MTPAFQDPEAGRLWARYFADVDRALRFSPADDASELRSELEAHLADSFRAAGGGSEAQRLTDAMARLGRPIDYLRPALADGLLDRGARGFHPVSLMRGLAHNLRLGAARAAIAVAFGLGYLLLAVFALMALLKPFWGGHVGLFRAADGHVNFGIVSNPVGAQELLGWWIVPMAIALCAVLYWLLTRALRAVRPS